MEVGIGKREEGLQNSEELAAHFIKLCEPYLAPLADIKECNAST